jgi:hypothetical protein
MLTWMFISHQCQKCHNLIQYFGQHIEIFRKKYFERVVEMNTDLDPTGPDPQRW